jgi:hypothetical protein
MHLIAQCSNCGANVRPELGVATATTVQHRDCADRFGVGTHGQSTVLPIERAIQLGPQADSVRRPPAPTLGYAVSSAS